ncbi:MAG: hypothetical protein CVV02_06505 [Firmicutes bacterium HGW-Firmicutes-7]|nr:MAG: hypothetical protein CVV02_06505 [Firmicutes bacterium HGW-Firmicutes-7]
MTEFVQNELHLFVIRFLLLASTMLLVFHFAYIQVKTKPCYHINKYIIAHILLLLWLVGMLLQYIVINSEVSVRISYLKEVPLIFVGYYIFLFAYSYSVKKPMSKKQSSLLRIIPVVCFFLLILAVVNGNSDLSLKLRYIYGTLVVIYLIIGLAAFVWYNLKKEGINRTKEKFCFLAVLGFDLFVHAIFYFEVMHFSVDVLILFMFLYLVIIVSFTIKHQLYDKIPFMLDSILSNANYGIIVINNRLEIVDINKDFFKQYVSIDGVNNLQDIIDQVKSISDNKLSVDNILFAVKAVEQNHFTGEVCVNVDERFLQLIYTVSSIFDERKEKIATMITFLDMTQMIHLQNGIINKNNQLIKANKKLEEHMKNMKKLTVEKERDALMTDINDIFGHSMTELIALLEVSGLLLEQDERDEVIEVAISESTSRARAALEEMRQSVSKYLKGVKLND